MKISKMNNETKTHIAAAVAAGAVTAEAIAYAVKCPNVRTVPTALIATYLTVGLFSRAARAMLPANGRKPRSTGGLRN